MTRLFMQIVNAARALPAMVLLFGAVILAGCGNQNVPDGPPPMAVDTTGSWPTPEIEEEAAAREADTVRTDTVLSLFNERHVLTITGGASVGRTSTACSVSSSPVRVVW